MAEKQSVTNATVTRVEIAARVRATIKTSRADSREIVDAVLEEIAKALEIGKNVKLSSFGTFQLHAKPARAGRNPKTGEPAEIRPRRVVSFKASPAMKDKIGTGPLKQV
jgi:integration host factor subunit alpha